MAVRLRDKMGPSQNGLRAAENHRPLRAIGLPAPQARDKLKKASERRPNTKDSHDGAHAFFKSNGRGEGCRNADGKIQQLALVTNKPPLRLASMKLVAASHAG